MVENRTISRPGDPYAHEFRASGRRCRAEADTLLQNGASRRAVSCQHIRGHVVAVTVQAYIDACCAKPEVADHYVVDNARHDRVAKADLVLLMRQLQAEAASEQAEE